MLSDIFVFPNFQHAYSLFLIGEQTLSQNCAGRKMLPACDSLIEPELSCLVAAEITGGWTVSLQGVS